MFIPIFAALCYYSFLTWALPSDLPVGFKVFGPIIILVLTTITGLVLYYRISQPLGFQSKFSTLFKFTIQELEDSKWTFQPAPALVKKYGPNPPARADWLVVSFAGAALKFGGFTTTEFNHTLNNLESLDSADRLFVFDPQQSFYMDDYRRTWDGYQIWDQSLQEITSKYRGVLFIGASMGASGAILFSQHADHIIAFNPILDFENERRLSFFLPLISRVPAAMRKKFKDRILRNLERSSAVLEICQSQNSDELVHSAMVKGFSNSHIAVFEESKDHCLPAQLKAAGKLGPLIQNSFLSMMKRRSRF